MNQTNSTYKKPSRAIVEIVRYFSLFISKIFWRIEYINKENIPTELESGLIVSSNHPTYFDPFWICIPIKRDMRFLAWDEAFEIFFVGRLLRLVGAFPVSLKLGGTIKALKQSLRLLREGKTLIVFPEGEREFADGKLLPFKTGAIRMAIETGVPILPVTIRGGSRIWSREKSFPQCGKVEIIYHPTIEFSKFDNLDTVQQMSDRLKNIIASEM